MTALLELQGIRKVFRNDIFKKQHVAVAELSLALPHGSCAGLLGPNGAGKTTTLRMILGLIKPDTGHILFEGRRLTNEARASIGYMPEVNKLPGALTVLEILRHQLRITRGSAPANILEAKLAQVGLTADRHKRLKQLSKGMARRVAWAQATIHEPKFLILDEPASGLDPLARRDLLRWITAEKQRGATILLCTHELAHMRTLCEQLVILNRGRAVVSTLMRDTLSFATSIYEIHISGEGEASLREFSNQRHLPAWQAFRQQGFLAILSFVDYAAATAWLHALVESERTILRFGDRSSQVDDELLAYFERAPS